MKDMTGGCQCGRVRYTVDVDNDDAYLCHCRMCQRATGGVSIAYKNVPIEKVTWAREPDWYRSSPIAHRPFCSTCGTPLGFAFLDDARNIDITVGSFDDPSRFRPTQHFAVESLHEAWIDTQALPRMRTDENDGIVKKWMDACGKLPD
jgi:hypothetical protein